MIAVLIVGITVAAALPNALRLYDMQATAENTVDEDGSVKATCTR